MFAQQDDPRDEAFDVISPDGKKIGMIWIAYYRHFIIDSKLLRKQMEFQLSLLRGNNLYSFGIAHIDNIISIPSSTDVINSPEMQEYNTMINDGRILGIAAVLDRTIPRALVTFMGKHMGFSQVPIYATDSEAIAAADALIQDAYANSRKK